MSALASDWNIVIAGAWNIAILTPQGIAKRLFKLDADKPLEIQFPVDMIGPIRVRHDHVIVMPSADRLVVQPVLSTDEGMLEAAGVAASAIASLPETPFQAIGLNFRYSIEASASRFADFFASPVDAALASSEFGVVDYELGRTITWKDGVINASAKLGQDSTGSIQLNFHKLGTTESELRAWLAMAQDMVETAGELLAKVFDLEVLHEETR